MTSTKYIGMDVHKESISIAVMNAVGKIVMGMRRSKNAESEHDSAVYRRAARRLARLRLKKEPRPPGCTTF